MKKQVLLRSLLGIPMGIAVGYIITIIISVGWGGGHYYPCVPALVNRMNSEICAVILQAVLCGLLGSVFGASSVIWEIENWSIVKQTGIYFLIIALVLMPIAYLANWMKHSFFGFMTYFGFFVLIFILIWLIQYLFLRKTINKITGRIK